MEKCTWDQQLVLSSFIQNSWMLLQLRIPSTKHLKILRFPQFGSAIWADFGVPLNKNNAAIARSPGKKAPCFTIWSTISVQRHGGDIPIPAHLSASKSSSVWGAMQTSVITSCSGPYHPFPLQEMGWGGGISYWGEGIKLEFFLVEKLDATAKTPVVGWKKKNARFSWRLSLRAILRCYMISVWVAGRKSIINTCVSHSSKLLTSKSATEVGGFSKSVGQFIGSVVGSTISTSDCPGMCWRSTSSLGCQAWHWSFPPGGWTVMLTKLPCTVR